MPGPRTRVHRKVIFDSGNFPAAREIGKAQEWRVLLNSGKNGQRQKTGLAAVTFTISIPGDSFTIRRAVASDGRSQTRRQSQGFPFAFFWARNCED